MKHFHLSILLVSAMGCALTAGLSAADPASVASPQGLPSQWDWPAETAAYQEGEGSVLAQSLCLQCHSVEYVTTQPRMPRKFWEATVKKMNEKYGAVLPPDPAPLINYLTTVYGKP